MTLTEKIRRLCEEKGETLASLERKMDFGNGTIRRWDTTVPSGDKLSKVADFFHVSVDYLLGKTSFRNAHEMIEYWGDFGPFFEALFDFGYLIKKERENQGVSREKMAEDIGITTQDLVDCEEGVLPIPRELADKMASYLHTNTSQLLFDYNLYPDTVPEEYHERVLEWENMRKEQDDAAKDGSVIVANFTPKTPTEHKLELLARHLDKVPDEQRERFIKNFLDSVDIYLDAMGIPKEDE